MNEVEKDNSNDDFIFFVSAYFWDDFHLNLKKKKKKNHRFPVFRLLYLKGCFKGTQSWLFHHPLK